MISDRGQATGELGAEPVEGVLRSVAGADDRLGALLSMM